MSGIMLNIVGGSFAPSVPTVIGQAFGGGYYAGQIGASSVATHYLIVGPVASAETSNIRWKNANTDTPNSASVIDGPQNTADMVADGSSTVYPAAHFCNNLVIGGFDDWYMPAKNELEVCYYNLKPVVRNNNTSSGANVNAIPSRASNYTAGTPARTSVSIFQQPNAEAFASVLYWTSTEASASNAWVAQMDSGEQITATYGAKNYLNRVRAVRRVAV
jgi:hypothetical protein